MVSFYFTDLTIERFCMTGGKSPIGYLKAYTTNLYLSKDAHKVTEAIDEGETPPNPSFSHAKPSFEMSGSSGVCLPNGLRASTSNAGHVITIERRIESEPFFSRQASLQPPCSCRKRRTSRAPRSCAWPSTATPFSSRTSRRSS